MKFSFTRNIIFAIVATISLLLVVNIILTRHNNDVIRKNHAVQTEVAKLRYAYDKLGKSLIQSLHVGLRGYHILQTNGIVLPIDDALRAKDTLLRNLEHSFTAVAFADPEYLRLKDSLNAYVDYATSNEYAREETTEMALGVSGKGANLWGQYEELGEKIAIWLDRVERNAQMDYDTALERNQVAQVLLLLVCVPTLLFTAFHSNKAFRLSERVQAAEADKNKMLREQNQLLEEKVAERTRELSLRNDEVTAQNEELRAQQETLAAQNATLQAAQRTIEAQNKKIQSLYDNLKMEVERQTMELRTTNQELIQQNSQLEQFAFIAAHNLRAPLTRVMGLANVIKMSKTEDERVAALEKLIASTHDTDQVVQDLNAILSIKRHTANLTEVELHHSLDRTKRVLEGEIAATGAKIIHNFSEAAKVYAIEQYVESILYNLLTNAIKYRDPARTPLIAIKTTFENEFVCLSVMDNGLGIDLSKYREGLFGLYKRFHLHVEGRGLGLYLVKTQIEALGGRVKVESRPNEGSTFSVYFKRYLI